MKQVIFLVVLVMVCSVATAVENILPFLPSQVEPSQDDFELEHQLWEMDYKLRDMQEAIDNLRQEQNRLENAQKSVELKGSGFASFSNFLIFGDGAENAQDFLGRPLWYDPVESESQTRGSKANETHKLLFIGRPSPNITINAGIKGSNIWAGSTQFSIDRLSIATDFGKIKTLVGTYWTVFTPLTLYYPSYPVWFESELFADIAADYHEDLGILGTQRRLGGVWSQYSAENFKIKGLTAKLRSRDGANPGNRHRFLYGLQLNLLPQDNVSLGLNWVSVKDDLASGTGAAVHGEVLGVTLQARDFWKSLSINGEYAGSYHNSDMTKLSPVAKDKALYGELIWQEEQLYTQLRFMQIGPLYRAPAAQSRDYALADPGVFGPANARTLMGGKRGEAANEALAYGLATPNREGVQLSAAYKPWPRVKVAAEALYFREILPAHKDGNLTKEFSSLRTFNVAKVGGEVSLNGLFAVGNQKFPRKPLQLSGQVEFRSTSREQDADSVVETRLSLQDTIVDLALSYEPQPGWKFLLGNKLFNNNDDLGPQSRKQWHNTFIMGVKIAVAPQISVSLTKQFVDFADHDLTSKNYDGRLINLTVKASF